MAFICQRSWGRESFKISDQGHSKLMFRKNLIILSRNIEESKISVLFTHTLLFAHQRAKQNNLFFFLEAKPFGAQINKLSCQRMRDLWKIKNRLRGSFLVAQPVKDPALPL